MNGLYTELWPDELRRDVVRGSLEPEPVHEAVRPGGVAPHELALRVVERPLVDGRPGQLVEVGSGPDVVGMEVRHEDAGHSPTRLLELGRPGLLGVGQADTRVDDGPPVVAGQEVRVHVARPRRQRQRDLADPTG